MRSRGWPRGADRSGFTRRFRIGTYFFPRRNGKSASRKYDRRLTHTRLVGETLGRDNRKITVASLSFYLSRSDCYFSRCILQNPSTNAVCLHDALPVRPVADSDYSPRVVLLSSGPIYGFRFLFRAQQTQPTRHTRACRKLVNVVRNYAMRAVQQEMRVGFDTRSCV